MNFLTDDDSDFSLMKIKTSKGFSYHIPNSIVLTTYPSIGIIFFLECSVRFFDGANYQQLFNTENQISTLSLRGKSLAIGQKLQKGQLTTTTILDLQTKKTKLYKFQKTQVQHLSLSANAEYLCSVGSSDYLKQEFFIIDLMEKLEFGFKTISEEEYDRKTGKIVSVVFSNKDPNLLAVAFSNVFTIVRIDADKASQRVAKSSKVREFRMSLFDPTDMNCYICSKNGDISDISVKEMKEVRIGPRKRVIISGIKHMRFVKPNRLVITGVKGFIALLELTEMKILKQVTIKQEITSLTEFEGDLGFIATDKASIYILNAEDLSINQFYSSHSAKINQICFLDTYCQVFASCAGHQIILWRNRTLTPIIKITLPNIICLSLNLINDGTSIISGWNDDCIRFFNPKTGKKINEIKNAHNGKITALTSNNASDRLYSGGEDGRIRSWKLEKQRFGIIDNIFSGHKSEIHCLRLYAEQLYSCSEDGSFGIWNPHNGEKKTIVKASNFLKRVIPIDQFYVYGVGSGPNLDIIAKNDGRVAESFYVGGSHLNDFDMFEREVRDQTQKITKKYLAFGGELHQVIVRKIDTIALKKDTIDSYQAYGEVTCVKFAPDGSSLIAATIDGSVLCFEFNTNG